MSNGKPAPRAIWLGTIPDRETKSLDADHPGPSAAQADLGGYSTRPDEGAGPSESVRHAARRESRDAGLDLEPIKARANAATPGPWRFSGSDPGTREFGWVSGGDQTICDMWSLPPNGTFIAAARTDVPALIAEVERLRAALASQRSEERVVRESFAVLGCDCIVVFNREADDTRPTIRFCEKHQRSEEKPNG